MPAASLPRFSLFNSESHILHSHFTDQDYEIGVFFPLSYFSSDRSYPVLFVPDGEYIYPAVAGLAPLLMGAREVPEMIIVGIAYRGISTWGEFSALRERDLLPQEFQEPTKTSRNPSYIRFYQEELFPLIQSHYRADPSDRGLFGFSSGGFFGLHVLFTQPGMFRRVVASSCTWPGPGEYFLDCARGYACRTDAPPADLFLSVGGNETDMLPGFNNLNELLTSKTCPNLRFSSALFEGESHTAGQVAKTILTGLKAVYQP